jgi:hypothetical protein
MLFHICVGARMCLAHQNVSNSLRRPAGRPALSGHSVRAKGVRDGLQCESLPAQGDDTIDCGKLPINGNKLASTVRSNLTIHIPKGRAAYSQALTAKMRKCFFGALTNRLPLPLTNRCQYVQNQPAARTPSVYAVTDAKQGELLAEVAIN